MDQPSRRRSRRTEEVAPASTEGDNGLIAGKRDYVQGEEVHKYLNNCGIHTKPLPDGGHLIIADGMDS